MNKTVVQISLITPGVNHIASQILGASGSKIRSLKLTSQTEQTEVIHSPPTSHPQIGFY